MKTKQHIFSFFMGIVGGMFVLGISLIFNNKSDATTKPIVHSLIQDYKQQNEGIPIHQTGTYNTSKYEINFNDAATLAIQAVVHVKTQFNAPNYTLYDFIFGTTPRYSTPINSSGSGVIISSDGYIVTNNHVIENAEIIEIILNDKRLYKAKLIGRDASADIALLKIEADSLPFIPYGESDELKIGDWVLAVGNPFNLTSTVTAGIVSAKARNINLLSQNMGIESFIQTDAAVNPGNSGGALVNLNGQLVGINTAIASKTGSFIGYSFAIPVSIVRKVVADLIEYGEVQRAYLGLRSEDINAKMLEQLDLEKPKGVYVSDVTKNGPAESVGISVGDIIIEVEGKPVNSNAELMEQISKYRPGDNIAIKIIHQGKEHNRKLKLENKYGKTEIVKSKSVEILGAQFEELTVQEKQLLRINHGLKISDLSQGKLLNSGIKTGYIITRINNHNIYTIKDIESVLNGWDGEIFIEGIYPNGQVAYYSLRQ
jgi:Do/DeqQ family serine protease